MGCLCSKNSKDFEQKKQLLRENNSNSTSSAVDKDVRDSVVELPHHATAHSPNGASHGKTVERAGQCRSQLPNTQLGCAVCPIRSKGESIISTPPSEALLRRIWINKRGHMVRTWKRRFCVLEKNELKYYRRADPHPPYGKGLKGSVSLLGAVCSVYVADGADGASSSGEGPPLCVSIFGDLGEKDLFFEVENTEEAREFARALHWAVRKITLSALVQDAQAKDPEEGLCADWLINEQKLFREAVASLVAANPVVQFLRFTKHGGAETALCALTLWTAQRGPDGDVVCPDETTLASRMGLSWQPLPDAISEGSSATATAVRTFALSDIQDVAVADHSELNTPASMTAGREGAAEKGCHHERCVGRPAKVVSFVLRPGAGGHSLDLLVCCVEDLGGFLLAVRTVVLHQALVRKLKSSSSSSSGTTAQRSGGPSAEGAAGPSKARLSGVAVCGACASVKHVPY